MSGQKYVVHFSGGAASYCAARRIIQEVGTEDVVLLFCDTKTEDADLYRFIDDAGRALGVPVTTISDGRDIWQVFRDTKMLGTSRFDPCSKILKRDLAKKWLLDNAPDAVQVFGFDWTEPHRSATLRERLGDDRVRFPLQEEPYLGRPDMMMQIEEDGIKPPRLYDLGAKHNNCGGGCVKAGQAHWEWCYRTMPEVYAEWERREQEMRDFLGRDVAYLRHRGGPNKGKPLTLKDFRQDIAVGMFDKCDWGVCHCFEVLSDDNETEDSPSPE